MSYTVIITEEIAANVAVTTTNYPITIEYNATNIASGSTYGNANVEALLDSGTMTTDIITTGAGDFGSIESGTTIVAAGNIVGSNIIANGQYLTNLAAGNVVGTVGLAQFVTQAAQANITSLGTLTGLSVNGAASATGNITGGNLITSGIVYTPQIEAAADLDLNVAGKVNVNGNLRVGDNNTDTQITTHGNGNLTLKTDNANSANIVVRWGTNANIDLVPHGTGQTNATGAVIATGNVQGSNIIGNGQYLTNLPAANVSGTVANAAYATTAGSATTATTATTANVALVAYSVSAANVSGTVANATYSDTSGTATTVTGAAQANITSVGTLTSLSVSGNVTAGNLISAGNLQSTQQTVIGTANVGTTGNIVVSGKNIATDVAWVPDGGNALTGSYGRVVVGTGWNGNIAHTAIQSRLTPADTISRTNTATQVRQFNAESFVTLNGNVTNGSFRQQGVGTTVRVGGGSAANTVSLANGGASIFAVSGGQFNIEVGNVSPYNLGNTTLSHAVVHGGALQPAAGSTITNAFGFNVLLGGPLGGSPGNIVNFTGYSSTVNLGNVTGNLVMFYNGNGTSATNRNVTVNNTARATAATYYAFLNDDDVAQMQLGSLRRYHEFESATATSGSFAIDKNVAQIHNIVPTGNCTITGYSNMVVTASDSVTNDPQVDTITIIVEQGATPYSVTLPTGAAFKYAGNVRTVGTTANSVTMISVTAANVGGLTTYLTTVSPEFV